MGIARLLAKGWVVFCLFAAAHAVHIAFMAGIPLSGSLIAIIICAGLFVAMGLLFVGGFGASAGHSAAAILAWVKPRNLIPTFNESVFLTFVILSFLDQVLMAPLVMDHGWAEALQNAIFFLVPGQRTLVDALAACTLDGGRVFASAFTWLLAIIYLASAVSRLRLTAGLIRLEAGARPQLLGPTLRAFLFGLVAVVGIQFLCVGSSYPWFPCSAFTDISGAVLIGLAPLMLSHLIVAALASLLASAPEN